MPDDLIRPLLIVHALATGLMTGLIWFVQVVHYPLIRRVPRRVRSEYMRLHQARTTLVVAPTMLVEVLMAGLLVLITLGWRSESAGEADPILVWTGAALLGGVWVSTFGVQVPMHQRMLAQPDDRLVEQLIQTNWVRTLLWSGRAVIAGLLLA